MPAKITPTEAQIQQVKNLFDTTNFGIHKVAKKVGLNAKIIRRIYKLLGISRKTPQIFPPTKEQIDSVKDMRTKGIVGAIKIAKKLGISKQIVKKIFKQLDITNDRTITPTAQQTQTVKDLYEKGISITKIAKDAKFGVKVVRRVLDSIDVELREQNITSPETIKNIVDLAKNGVIRDKIAETLDIHVWTVNKYAKDAGIIASEIAKHKPSKTNTPEKVCTKCPENGLQQIANFHGRIISGKEVFSSICKKCLLKMANDNNKIKRKTNPMFALRCAMSTAIGRALKSKGSSKNGESCLKYLYTINELYTHIESLFEPWMNWENYGLYDPKTWNQDDKTTWKWQVDHIKPQSEFEYEVMADEGFKECWGLANLRPLSAQQNALDGAKMTRHESKKKNRHKKA